jgi:hypothetical protein
MESEFAEALTGLRSSGVSHVLTSVETVANEDRYKTSRPRLLNVRDVTLEIEPIGTVRVPRLLSTPRTGTPVWISGDHGRSVA